jgi:hypothetical protein
MTPASQIGAGNAMFDRFPRAKNLTAKKGAKKIVGGTN